MRVLVCLMTPQLLNTIGLVMNIVGALLLVFYGFPQPSHEEGVGLGLEDNTPLQNGQTVAQHNAEIRARKAKYLLRSKLAMVLILLGFALQLWALWR